MRRLSFPPLAIITFFQFMSITVSSPLSMAQEWEIQKARGTITVVDLFQPTVSVVLNYAEGLVSVESDMRWIEYDPLYEKMWKDMAKAVDRGAQEEKIQQLEQYVFGHAYRLFTYSPLSLYAVNKEVDFVPQKLLYLRLKETSVTDSHWSLRD